MPPLSMFTTNLKWHIHLYFKANSLPVSTSGNLTRSPPPLLPLYPLMALVHTLVSLILQLIVVLTESSFIVSP